MSSSNNLTPESVPPPPRPFGALLRRHRVLAGLTQEALAERAGLSMRAISDLERGVNRTPQPGTLDLLAEALQLSAEERARFETAARREKLAGLPTSTPPTPLGLPVGTPKAGGGGAHSLEAHPPEEAMRAPSLEGAFGTPSAAGEAHGRLVSEDQPHTLRRPLPMPPTPLIGREQETQTVCALLQRPEVRLVTLTGSAGVGKTRLALQVAMNLAQSCTEGVEFVPLDVLTDSELVLPAMAQALGLHATGTLPVLTVLTTALYNQQRLLILDNFEQVIAAAPHLADLLAACPHLKLLVTSREVLHLRAEHQFVVPPLEVSPTSQSATPQPLDLAALEATPAVQLFLQRSQAVQLAFQITPGNAASVAEICQRLEGIPLALELAAPRLKVLSPQALLARLEGRLQVLTGGACDLPERQRTMRATIAWSYELLTPSEQALLRRLSVFVGSWRLSAAEQVCLVAGPLGFDLLDGLSSLLDKSLVRQDPGSDEEPRYRLLYVLREFGLERLDGAGEQTATREAHAACYLALAEEAGPQMRGAAQKAWLDRLEQEYDNLRAALIWWLGRAEQANETRAAELALRLCGGLFWFWASQYHHREGQAFLERALAVRVGVDAAVQVKALLAAAKLLVVLNALERAEALAQEAVALARQTGDAQNTAWALVTLGWAAVESDHYSLARACYEEAPVLFQQTGDAHGRGTCLQNLADLVLFQGEYERAERLLEEALALFQALGHPRHIGQALASLGWVRFIAQRDLPLAASLVEQGLALARKVGDFGSINEALAFLGAMYRHQGKLAEARALLEEGPTVTKEKGALNGIVEMQNALARVLVQQGELAAALALYQENQAILPTSGSKLLIADSLEGRAVLEAALDKPKTAARLWGAAEALREAIGAPMYPVYRAEYAQTAAAVRTQMGEAAFAAAWEEGRHLTPEEVLATAD